MFGFDSFYFGTTRKMITYFGTVFNDLNITRTDSSGDQSVLLKVPLTYGPKRKDLLRADTLEPEEERQPSIILPSMSYSYINSTYDADRKLGTTRRYWRKDNNDLDKAKRQYNLVPYNFYFQLYIYSKFQEDSFKILEQITPWFSPEWTATVNFIPEMSLNMDLPIILDSVSYEDSFDGTFEDRRMIIYTLDFHIKSYYACPIVSKPIIKLANTNFYIGDPEDGNDRFYNIVVTPGLDANGNPTTNSQVTIPSSNIAIDDNYGYIVTETDETANTGTP